MADNMHCMAIRLGYYHSDQVQSLEIGFVPQHHSEGPDCGTKRWKCKIYKRMEKQRTKGL